MLENYTPQGIDKFCIDLGIITVCSYQQLYVKKLSAESLKENQYEKYKYVICDECHFFTGDSLFNPCTEEILSFIVTEYRNAIRIYMSATLEDTFIPIIEKEYELSDYDYIDCIYYYFERNYDYIKKIYAYRELNQLVPKIKEDEKSKWLIFVSSKSKGKKFKENLKNFQPQDENLEKILSKANVKVAFLKSESKDTKTYQDIVEKEKFEEQVLISTSVLDNGINIKDRQVKNVVIDLLDRTEFIQMLGRVRITGNMQINLYIRNYSTEEVEKFLIEDVESMIARLSSDFQKECRNIFFNIYSDPRYKTNELFYIVSMKQSVENIIFLLKTDPYFRMDSKEIERQLNEFIRYTKYFGYNHCAIYKLVERISVFMEILKSQESEYFLPSEKLNRREAIGTRLYNHYVKSDNPENILLKKHIFHILESESNHKHRIKNECWQDNFSLRNDFLVRMLENLIITTEKLQYRYEHYSEQEEQYASDSTYNDDGSYETYAQKAVSTKKKVQYYKQQKEHQESLLSSYNSEVPILTEQAHWIERVLNHSSDFEYLEEIKEEPKLTEHEIEEFLKKYSVKLSDYPDELQQHKNNWSFKKLEILDKQGALITDFKDDTEKPKIKEYQKVFKFFYEQYGIDSPDDLIDISEDEAYTIGNTKYKLVKAKGTKTDDRKIRYLFLEINDESI